MRCTPLFSPKQSPGIFCGGFYRDGGRNPLRHIVQSDTKAIGSVSAKALFKKN
ncbi:hypothetical protein CEV33_2914 [Brucella grignonensis]|uniref:Uncharacterized protein n=1 Tax=Brucella grignonensis TaxID=94627 RepID=A0A256F2W1_9HYPH|nr:hypothetical protein CEV33_2914 [Brucella grignonensis]